CCKRPGVKIKTSTAKILFNDLAVSAEKKIETVSDGMVLQNKNRVDLVNRQSPDNSCRIYFRCCRLLTNNNLPLLVVDGAVQEISYFDSCKISQIDTVWVMTGCRVSGMVICEPIKDVIIISTKRSKNSRTLILEKDRLLNNKIIGETIVQGKPTLSIYPNPVLRGQTCKISVTNITDMLLNIVVLDQSGRIMLQKESTAMGKEGPLSLMIGMGWPAGLYHVRVYSNDQNQKTNFQLASSFIVQ
ncbi:MAG: T9SS type A sorting domain-containing protein, partial [Sphingobacteriales bacterium]|nr:T9SS type A sorting domain-containing protein [Sphingobacteriales bacterium]